MSAISSWYAIFDSPSVSDESVPIQRGHWNSRSLIGTTTRGQAMDCLAPSLFRTSARPHVVAQQWISTRSSQTPHETDARGTLAKRAACAFLSCEGSLIGSPFAV